MKNYLVIAVVIAALVLVIPSVMACPGPQEDCYCEYHGAWHNGRCPQGQPHENDCCQDEFRTGRHGGWYHQHGELICPEPECTNGMGFRVSIPSSQDPAPYNIGSVPATVDFWSNPYPGVEDPFPVGTTFLWNFGDGITSTEGPNAVYHTYTTPGTYDVSLTVTFPEGCPDIVTETKKDYLLVTAVALQQSGHIPFNNPYWLSGFTCEIGDGIPLDVLEGTNLRITAYYSRQADGYMAMGNFGETSCTSERYWTDCLFMASGFGGGYRTFNIGAPLEGFRFVAVKDSPVEPGFAQIQITISNADTGEVLLEDSTTGDQTIYDRSFTLIPRSGC